MNKNLKWSNELLHFGDEHKKLKFILSFKTIGFELRTAIDDCYRIAISA